MRFAFATVLVIAAAFASSISARPFDADVDTCDFFCLHDRQCDSCPGAGVCGWYLLCELLVTCRVDQRAVKKTSVELAEFSFDWEILDMTLSVIVTPAESP
ncbi:hypothetical protein F4604DRAFT_1819032 [Suillus subluteus]|nr:hypothetical protein F4604DRAFT_1819032 [Suillus subluteus]